MDNFTGQKPAIIEYNWQIMAEKDHGWFHSNNAIPTSDVLKLDQLKVFKGSCFFFTVQILSVD